MSPRRATVTPMSLHHLARRPSVSDVGKHARYDDVRDSAFFRNVSLTPDPLGNSISPHQLRYETSPERRFPPSFGPDDDAFNNALPESVWPSTQIELPDRKKWRTRLKFTNAMVDRVDAFYSRQRRHSSLDYIPPVEFELPLTNQTAWIQQPRCKGTLGQVALSTKPAAFFLSRRGHGREYPGSRSEPLSHTGRLTSASSQSPRRTGRACLNNVQTRRLRIVACRIGVCP